MTKIIVAIVLVSGCFFNSCKSKHTTGDILPIDSMKLVMWDMMRADELAINQGVKDTGRNRKVYNIELYREVLSIHHLTKEQFYQSYHFYLSRPDLNKILIDSLNNYAERKRNQQYEQKKTAPPK